MSADTFSWSKKGGRQYRGLELELKKFLLTILHTELHDFMVMRAFKYWRLQSKIVDKPALHFRVVFMLACCKKNNCMTI